MWNHRKIVINDILIKKRMNVPECTSKVPSMQRSMNSDSWTIWENPRSSSPERKFLWSLHLILINSRGFYFISLFHICVCVCFEFLKNVWRIYHQVNLYSREMGSECSGAYLVSYILLLAPRLYVPQFQKEQRLPS